MLFKELITSLELLPKACIISPLPNPIGLSNLKYILSFPSHLTISVFAFDYCSSITFTNKQHYDIIVCTVL